MRLPPESGPPPAGPAQPGAGLLPAGPPAPPAGAHGTRRMRQVGEIGDLLLIHTINVLLKWVTLNIYHFWGKTRLREYLWSHQSFEGDRFEYTGRGKELFFGFLKAVAAVAGLAVVAMLLYTRLTPSADPLFVSTTLLLFAIAQYVMALAGYTARVPGSRWVTDTPNRSTSTAISSTRSSRNGAEIGW